ncbi:hypothetical protein CTA2_10417 [Colletotrichum tanaceti]|uniref:Uncharacterized protein n=1 Tax=Colletotrichum tanaceti TaxID=1306861 RepID=A0A4U6XJY8_9PEZI|nr:hypothetical protein CTA2_10417 [Colletotrichum tanaceti]TKW54517.1 hypothetical protein CTA1_5427 [Colletotrichum tanaceti]
MPTVSHILGPRSLPKISTIQNGPLSPLQPYGTILCASSIVAIVILANVLERWLLRAIYGKIYTDLQCPGNEKRRRSFTYCHLGAINTFAFLCIGFFPVMKFLAGSAMYTAYYIFELCYRTQFASYISIAHHAGLIAITQTSLLLFSDWDKHPEATIEFYMCMVWGVFDVVVEFPINVSMIIWRVKRNNHKLLAYLTAGLCVWVVVGACTEVAVTIYLLHKSWERWGTVWKFVTPFVFSLWIATQLFGASRLFLMSQSERRNFHKGALQVVEPVVEIHETMKPREDTASESS